MALEVALKVITGNALLDGDVIYLNSESRWIRDLRFAEVLDDPVHAKVRLLQAQGWASEVVGAYLADVIMEKDRPIPVHFREDFRAKGPSNYFHGHQEKVQAHV